MAKRTPKKTSPGPPRWRTRRVGSGITEKTVKQLPVEELLKIRPEDWNARFVDASRKNETIAWACGILEKAKLPTDPSRIHPRPGGGSCTLHDLVVLRGYKELVAPEWFAAKILTCWHEAESARSALRKTHLPEKARRWYESQLHRYTWEFAEVSTTAKMKFRWEEKVLKHRRLGEGGSKGGGHEKRRLGIEQAIRGRLTKSPGLSARALWDQLMRYREEAPLHVEDYEIYGIDVDKDPDDQKLVQFGVPTGEAKYLKFRSFKDYVSRLKKEDK